MRAVIAPEPGGPDALRIIELPDPVPEPGEVVIAVAASAVNRADLMQRQGFYPPPPGVTDVLGLECSGIVEQVGDGVRGIKVGDEVCALLSGGGYAEKVVVPVGQVLPIPDGIPLADAASLPEVAATVWSNLIGVTNLRAGETVLVHGGAGGIGTFAIQWAAAMGARVIATAGSPEKVELCRSLGAEVGINYKTEDFVEVVKDLGGTDVILDNMGAKYLERNVDALAVAGHIVIIGLQGGVRGELNIGMLLSKRASVSATSLRARPADEKATICAAIAEHVWPMISDGRIKVAISQRVPFDEVARAHQLMDQPDHTGKILIEIG